MNEPRNQPEHQADIEELATRCSFHELTPDEQSAVLRVVASAEEYELLRATILRSGRELRAEQNDMSVSSTAPAALHKALAGKRQVAQGAPHKAKPILLRPMAFYQTLIVAAACVMTTMFFMRSASPTTPLLPSVVRDTVQQIVYHELDRDSLAQLIADSIRSVLALSYKQESGQFASAFISAQRRLRHRRDSLVQTASYAGASPEFNQKGANRFVGLANMPSVLEQKRGRSFADNPDMSKVTFVIQR